MKNFLTCSECSKQKKENKLYPRDEIINYKGQNYCPKCYAEKLEKEKFSEFICNLFGLKAPGPVIYSQRKRLKEKYYYTDETIMKTLRYIYDIKKCNKLVESLGLVTPENVEAARKYFNREEKKYDDFKTAIIENQKATKVIVPMKKKPQKEKANYLDNVDWDD